MSYQSGKMGIAECLAMVFMMTFSSIFLTMPAHTLVNQAALGWVSVILNGLMAMVMLYAVYYASRGQEQDLLQLVKGHLGMLGFWLVGLYYCGLFWTIAVSLLRQYTENTLLTALPEVEFMVVLLTYGLTISIIVYIGLEPVCRATYLIIPFALVGLLIVLAALIPYYNVHGLFPLQGNGWGVFVRKGLLTGGINVACIAPALMAATFHDRRTWFIGSLFGVGLSVGLKTLGVLVFTLIFGVAVGQERMLPFYELSRLVYLGRFVQRIESLFIMLWVISGILAVALNLYMGIYLFTRLFNLPSIRPLLPVATVLTAALAALPTDAAAVIQLETIVIRTVANGGLYGVPLLLLLLSLWKGRTKAGRTI